MEHNEIVTILESKKYQVNTTIPSGDGWMVYVGDRRGLTNSTIEKRLAKTGLRCDRFGYDFDNGHYLYVVER